jgi:hypothetical protein
MSLYRLASNFLVLRDNPILNHSPRLVVKWVNNIHGCTVSHFSSRHKKKMALFLAVGESKALNDKTVIYRDGCICLDPLIIGNTNFDARDLYEAPSISGKPNDDEIEEGDY